MSIEERLRRLEAKHTKPLTLEQFREMWRGCDQLSKAFFTFEAEHPDHGLFAGLSNGGLYRSFLIELGEIKEG